MKKRLIDYIHFYPLNPIAICEPDVEPVGHHLEGLDWGNEKKPIIAERVNYPAEWIKLILKPLSAMTDEQRREFASVLYKDGTDIQAACLTAEIVYQDSIGFTLRGHCYRDETFQFLKCTPQQMQWLCDNGFDIFGLKELGLAIYKGEKI